VNFKVVDDPSIDTTSRTRKLVTGKLENDIRRGRQMDGIAKAKDRGVKFGRKRELTDEKMKEIRTLRELVRPCRLSSNGWGSARQACIEPSTPQCKWLPSAPPGGLNRRGGLIVARLVASWGIRGVDGCC
jgi:hypothetical protein